MVKPLIAAALFVGCAAAPPPPPPKTGPPPPALDVYRVHVLGRPEEPPSVAVILTRPVAPVPDALAVVDQDGAKSEGRCVWLGAQLVAFYAASPAARGQELHLKLAVPLRTTDGGVLEPRELQVFAPLPHVISADVYNEVKTPMLEFEVRARDQFGRAVQITAADLDAHGQVLSDDAPVPFKVKTMSKSQEAFIVTPSRPLTPGKVASFGWREGARARTSIGVVFLAPVRAIPSTKFEIARIGGENDRCHEIPKTAIVDCSTQLLRIEFSTPVTRDELALHTHPPLEIARWADARGHVASIPLLGVKKLTLVLDGALTDTLGRTLVATQTLEIQNHW